MHIDVIHSPNYFALAGSIIGIIGTLLMILVGMKSFNIFSCFKKNCSCESNHLCYLGTSFILLAIALLAEVVTTFLIDSSIFALHELEFVSFTGWNLFILLWVVLSRLLLVFALFLLFLISSKKHSYVEKSLILFLLLAIALFTVDYSYVLFNLAVGATLFAISYQYILISKKNKNQLTKQLSSFFFIYGFSFILLVLVQLLPFIYLISKIIAFIAFLILLKIIISLSFNHGSKKK